MGSITLFGKVFKRGSIFYVSLLTSFAANATFIVSNDKHYDVLKEIDFPKLLVLRLKEFLGLLQSEE